MNEFELNKLTFKYSYHNYGNSACNERTVEVPLGSFALDCLRKRCETNEETDLVEVGAVMGFYEEVRHKMVDLYEIGHPLILNQNMLDYDFRGRNVLSISTVEHVGREELGRKDILGDNLCIEAFDKLVREAKYYFITTPIGFAKHLDSHIQGRRDLNPIVLRRKEFSNYNHWEQERDNRNFNFNYGMGFAVAICITTNLPEFFS